MENFESEPNEPFQPQGVLPKPLLVEDKKNWVRRSLISLAIYIALFMLVFGMDMVYIAAILIVLLIHEFGHFFAMKAFKYNNVKLFFIPLLGAYVTGKKHTISQRQMSIVILAGPLPGIIIGSCLVLYNLYYPNERVQMLGNIFCYINLFNLLPFIPLDGGRLLETLFVNQNHIIRVIFTIISVVCMLVIAMLFESLIFLIIPVSMIFDLILEIKNQKIRDYLSQENINYTINYNDLPDKDYWIIRDCILLSFSKRYAGIQAGVQQYSPAEGSILQHVITVLKTPLIKDIGALGKIFIMLIYILFLVVIPLILLLVKIAYA